MKSLSSAKNNLSEQANANSRLAAESEFSEDRLFCRLDIIPHESDAVRQLRYDIADQRQQLEALEDEIADFYDALYAFEREYQKRLGDLAAAVGALRTELGMTDSQSSVTPALTQLIDEDYQRLKTAYRQAAKRCHPDQLSEAHREAGLALFDSLNKAYHLQDLVQVEHILWLLETGQAFSDTPVVVTDAELLERRKILLSLLTVQQQDHLEQLKMREDYDVSNRDNWNILLYDYQTQLEDELAVLRGRLAALG
ncbi:MAG: hypothetical protein CR974_01590 [Gammaproteobacteria bacterium]|nr:MAG: hypothetical protein CR974_01590 [Gammaproteobacteria bacterium]